MVVVAVLGTFYDEYIPGFVLWGMLGLIIGQVILIRQLVAKNTALTKELGEFSSRFEYGTSAMYERLLKVEEHLERAASPVVPEEVQTSVQQEVPHQILKALEPVARPESIVVEDEAGKGFDWNLHTVEAASDALPEKLPELQNLSGVSSEIDAPLNSIAETTPHVEPEMSPETPPVVSMEPPEIRVSPVQPKTHVPQAPQEPSFLERSVMQARNWLLGGNTVLRVGVLLLFLGLAFLLRYATEGIVVPLELRYAGVAGSAVALLGLGWWLRHRKPEYGLILQGTGIAVLYLTVFAAMRLHPLLDPGMAFALLVFVTVFSAILAVAQNALGLAAAAALGGFAAPILTSTGSGNHVALFSYFALLNTGIFAIAWFRAWRLLNLIGFVGTFGIASVWGTRSYEPELFASTEPFLILFLLMYVAVGLLFARRKLMEASEVPQSLQPGAELLRWSARQADYVDGTMLFGPPIIGFGLQYALIQHMEFGPAFSALALGMFYMLLAGGLSKWVSERGWLLVESCLALGVIFGSLAIPLALDARWTSAAWAVEGAGLYWLGLRQGRVLARGFALLLQMVAVLLFLGDLLPGSETLLSGAPLGALLLGLSLLFSFWQFRQAPSSISSELEHQYQVWLGCAGLAFLYLIAPLCFATDGTAISWAIAGLLTVFIGSRLQLRSFLFMALGIQLLAGVFFLLGMDSGGLGEGYAPEWRGLLTASLIGFALMASVPVAARTAVVKDNVPLLRGISMVLLVGLILLNLGVLFVLPWRSASAVWGGSALLILWLSLRLQQTITFVFALILQLLAGLVFLVIHPFGIYAPAELKPLAHAGFWTPVVLSVSALLAAYFLQFKQKQEQEQSVRGGEYLERLPLILLVWSILWWAFAGLSEIGRFIEPASRVPLSLVFISVSVGLYTVLAYRKQWHALAMLCLLLMPALCMMILGLAALVVLLAEGAWFPAYHPAANWGWLGWGMIFMVHLFSLRKLDALVPANLRSAAHVLGCWLIIGILSQELRYLLMLLAGQENAWGWLGWAILPSAYLMWVSRGVKVLWPVSAYGREYRSWAAFPMALLMLVWFWLANIRSDGAADPLPYLPFLNPLELGLLFALLGVCLWVKNSEMPFELKGVDKQRLLEGIAGSSLFVLLTVALFRTVHHWAAIPFTLQGQMGSMLVQAGLSLLWTSIALGLMISGHLRARRELWIMGAGLIGLVVIKLFFIELGNSGSLERIVSFIGVGVLLLIVGYFAPLPPRSHVADQELPEK